MFGQLNFFMFFILQCFSRKEDLISSENDKNGFQTDQIIENWQKLKNALAKILKYTILWYIGNNIEVHNIVVTIAKTWKMSLIVQSLEC